MRPGFQGNPMDLIRSKVMRVLLQQKLVAVEAGRFVSINHEQGRVEYVDPMASIFHLVSPESHFCLSHLN